MGNKIVEPRKVAVAIPFSVSSQDGRKVICLVSSRKHEDRYVLPKGGVEEGESSREAAIREMWEEAGLVPVSEQGANADDEGAGRASKKNAVTDHKAHKKSPVDDPSQEGFVARAVYEAHEVRVQRGEAESEREEWPEMHERKRRWVPYQEALELIQWRKDIHELLVASSVSR